MQAELTQEQHRGARASARADEVWVRPRHSRSFPTPKEDYSI